MSEIPRVAVLGAGVTGLSAAYELTAAARRGGRQVEVTVLEASERLGGKVLTEVHDGAVVEGGPDSFMTVKPHALDLIEELGLSGELIGTNPEHQTIWIYSGGRLRGLPDGLSLVPRRVLPFLLSDVVGWRAKARMGLEPFIKAGDGSADESLADFTRRRLGQEALDKLVGPMLAGIYAGDPDKMSLESTFPHLKEMERRGGLLRCAWRAKAGKGPSFMSLRGGLSRLVEALASHLPAGALLAGTPALGLARRGARWRVQVPGTAIAADAVIAALPANVLSRLVAGLDGELARELGEIPFVSTATASLLYDGDGFPDPLAGCGFMVPRGENLGVAAATFTSTKWPGRAPRGRALIRCFVGGTGREELPESAEQTIAEAAHGDLRRILKLGERRPRLCRVFRWTKANPQYHVGHASLLRRIAERLQFHPGLALAGCSYQGVGLPDCIRSGREAARKTFQALSAPTPVGIS